MAMYYAIMLAMSVLAIAIILVARMIYLAFR